MNLIVSHRVRRMGPALARLRMLTMKADCGSCLLLTGFPEAAEAPL
jgi:hypothetical protein